ncbi:unnamed protein product [Notodromas monacha]|uniref:F-box domain-containing protein n=1 Tax=Notodromas monacha TaxID=399045 RepID=A0A7R9BID9_9CRUS|nr:unnamed protein product [Notodromas monacha]CAG0916071.1 unnamed protein product [Notodromas monacha]
MLDAEANSRERVMDVVADQCETEESDWEIFPLEIVEEILRRSSVKALLNARLVCREWCGLATEILKSLKRCDWDARCIGEVPRAQLYQLINALGLRKAGDENDDGVLEVVDWRLRFPVPYLKMVPMYESKDVLMRLLKHPTKISFDRRAAFEAWLSPCIVTWEAPSVTHFTFRESATCAKVSGDVLLVGDAHGRFAAVDLDTGLEYGETIPTDNSSIKIIEPVLLPDGLKFALPGTSAVLSHNSAICVHRSGRMYVVHLNALREAVFSTDGIMRSTFEFVAVRSLGKRTELGSIAHVFYLPELGDIVIVGRKGFCVLRQEYDYSPSSERKVIFPPDCDTSKASPANWKVFRADAMSALRMRDNLRGLHLSADAKKFAFFPCFGDDVLQVDILGDLLALGTETGVVMVFYLKNSSESFMSIDKSQPQFKASLKDYVDLEIGDEIHSVCLSHGAGGFPFLVVATQRFCIKFRWVIILIKQSQKPPD